MQLARQHKKAARLKKAAWIFLMMLPAISAHAAGNALERGMQHYQKHHYEQAIEVLYAELTAANSARPDKIYLGLGMSCLANARLYQDLYQAAMAFNRDYLTRLLPSDGPSETDLSLLYLGKIHLEAGELAEAVGALDKFLAAKNPQAPEKDLAKIALATAYYLQGKHDQARQLWAQIKLERPAQITALAAAYSRVSLADQNPLAMSQEALDRIEQAGGAPSIQNINDLIYVYTRHGSVKKGLALIKQADFTAFFHQEIPAENKVIRYYDSAMLGNLAAFYGKAALEFLAEAYLSTDNNIKGLALYYLGEGNGLLGHPDQSLQWINEFISTDGNPPRLKTRARIRRAFNHYRLGNNEAAHKELKALLQSEPGPDLMADILLDCIQLQFEVSDVVISASALAQRGEGRSFFRLNFALGKYYLWKKDYAKAVAHMEAGRDKSNKNRIEFNDPVMLVNLAQAYYRCRQFSEALEIFFEMSKQYPAVRQIQVVLQGVYSMEQKSAGDVRIL